MPSREYIPKLEDIWYSVQGKPGNSREHVERWSVSRVLTNQLVLRRGKDRTVTISRRTHREVGDSGPFQAQYYPDIGDRGLELKHVYRLQVAKYRLESAVQDLRKAMADNEQHLGITRYLSAAMCIEALTLAMIGTLDAKD